MLTLGSLRGIAECVRNAWGNARPGIYSVAPGGALVPVMLRHSWPLGQARAPPGGTGVPVSACRRCDRKPMRNILADHRSHLL